MGKILAIAHNTFRESVRSKVLYSFFFFALFMVLVSAVFSTTTIGDKMKLLKDFGLAVMSLSATAFVVVSGSALLAKELQRRTVFNILAKPVRRYEFIFGKFLGLFITSLSLVALMGTTLSALLWAFEGQFDASLLVAYFGIALELFIVCACVIFFSTIVVTPMLNGLFTFCVFLAGRSVQHLASFAQDADMPATLRMLSRALFVALPHLDQLYFANDIVYGIIIPLEYLFWASMYAFAYAGVLLTISVVFFSRRSFN